VSGGGGGGGGGDGPGVGLAGEEEERVVAETLAALSERFGSEGAAALSRRLNLVQKCGGGGGGGGSFFHEAFCEAIITAPAEAMTTTKPTAAAAAAAATPPPLPLPSPLPPPPPPPSPSPPPPATVTLRGLARARSTLEDFVSSYFMFYGGAVATRSPTLCSHCTGAPVHARRILRPGLATRPLTCGHSVSVYPYTLAASSSLAWPLVP